MANATFRDMARNTFTHSIKAFLLFAFVKPTRSFNLKGITKQKRKRATQHTEFCFQNAKNIFEQFLDIAFVDNGDADLLDNRNFGAYWRWHGHKIVNS